MAGSVRARKRATREPASVRMVPLNAISPCPENTHLYNRVDPECPDVQALAESIRAHGVREPLVITVDGFLLSGHRRRIGAMLASLSEVPFRIEPIRYCDSSSDEILHLLREHNRQRVKSLDEMLREEVVTADPTEAYDALIAYRAEKSDICPAFRN